VALLESARKIQQAKGSWCRRSVPTRVEWVLGRPQNEQTPHNEQLEGRAEGRAFQEASHREAAAAVAPLESTRLLRLLLSPAVFLTAFASSSTCRELPFPRALL
jgi:hypothetical protein